MCTKVRRDFVCGLTDEQVGVLSPRVRDQIWKVKEQGATYPPASPHFFNHKAFFLHEFKRDKEASYHNLSNLDQVKLTQFVAQRFETITGVSNFDACSCSDAEKDLLFLASVHSAMPFVDLSPSYMMLHKERHRKTMDIFRSQTEALRVANGTDVNLSLIHI